MTPAEAAVAVAVGDVISRELDEDFVGMWVIPWHIRRRLASADDEVVQEVAGAILAGLVESAVRVGTLSEDSGVFTAWPARDGIERALQEWRALGRDPNIGEVAWLARER